MPQRAFLFILVFVALMVITALLSRQSQDE